MKLDGSSLFMKHLHAPHVCGVQHAALLEMSKRMGANISMQFVRPVASDLSRMFLFFSFSGCG